MTSAPTDFAEFQRLRADNARLAALNAQLERELRALTADNDALEDRVSAARDATDEAERIGRIKDEFLSLLSHELRTPLASVLMHAQLLQHEGFSEVDSRRAIAAVERGARTQLQMIDDLLDASRIIAGELQVERADCDLVGLIREAIESVRPSSERKRVAIECLLDAAPSPIWADPTRMRKVVASIVGNAIKFTDPGGHVCVTLTTSNHRAELRVRDEGCGIELDFLPHVFDRLVQEDSSQVRRHGGLGLGLAIAKHVVTACGGTVAAESRGRGKGATFAVSLPLRDAATADRTRESSPADHPLDRPGRLRPYAMLRGLPILVVDDDAATRDAIVEVLALSGAEVRSAASAAEAMAILDGFEPKVLVSDIAMPDEDGYSFMRRLRKRGERGRSIRAIALTALSTERDRGRANAAGFDTHVAKPVDIDRLRDAVAELLEH